MPTTALRVAARPREFVAVRGPDAASYLQAMVSNDVEGLAVGEACEALLLTSKARVIAPLVVLRRAEDDFLLLTEPGLGERVQRTLVRSRFAKQCEIEPEEHTSTVVLGDAHGIPTVDYGVPAVEVLDAEKLEPTMGAEELELLRIRAGTPRFGREIDDRVLPAEAGLEERAIDFEKGCYIGQEPVARLHYRGKPNRRLRGLRLSAPAAHGDQLFLGDREVGTIGSSCLSPAHGPIALAIVRREAADGERLAVGGGGGGATAELVELPFST